MNYLLAILTLEVFHSPFLSGGRLLAELVMQIIVCVLANSFSLEIFGLFSLSLMGLFSVVGNKETVTFH